jgi:putative ABC transport system ATP-binding protein
MTSTPSNSLGLALRGITATVPDGDVVRTLLDAVDLEIAPGELVVVTGPSGSGKSTLLSIAGLLAHPAAGEVVVAGISAAGCSEARRTALRRTHIGIVYQSANLIPSLSAIEQLELVGRINHDKPRRSAQRAASLLEEVGLASRAHALPSELSGGERQRVGIARALMAEPSVLLCDEPTSSLDPALAEDIATLLAAQTRRRSLATLLVTHDEEPLAHADRRVDLVAGGLRELATKRS